jgi:hypothetical protein
MSTVKAVNLQHPNSSNINMVLGADGSVSGGIPAGGRNRIINGGFDVWQRGTSFSSGSTYNADRWWGNNTAVTTNWSQESTIVPQGFRYSMKISQTTNAAYVVLAQPIETANTIPIAGQTVTLSGYFAADTSATINLNLYYSTSNDVSPGGTWIAISASSGGSGTVSTTSSFTRLTGVFSIPSNAKSLKAEIVNPSLPTTKSIYIAGVQLEIGSFATPFEFKSYAQELRECERYYQRLSNWTGFAEGTTAFSATFPLHQPLRGSPAITAISGSTLTWRTAGASDGSDSTWSIVAPSTDSRTGIWVLITNVADLIDGHPYQNRYNNANALIEVSAEL